MFATLLGDLPRPDLPPDAPPETLLATIVEAQEAVGLEPISDAGFGIGASPVERWRATASRTQRLVKQVVIGPVSRSNPGALPDVRGELMALAEAGCPYIEVREPAVVGLAGQAGAAALRKAHDNLLDGLEGVHVSLVITGGNADRIGTGALLTAGFASFGFDLINGPDNWRLIAAIPGDRGIVCGVVASGPSADQAEVLLWAAEYAASTQGRGRARIGLATSGSLAQLPWETATRKLGILGDAVTLAALPKEQRVAHLDPRAVDIRSAALGRFEPKPRGPGPRRQAAPEPDRD